MSKINVLHISNGFLGLSKVHRYLYSAMDNIDICQIIFAVNRKNKRQREEAIIEFKTNQSKIIYSRFIKPYHRFLFNNKANFLYKDLVSQTNVEKIDISHATTLFSDGILALKLFNDYNKKYIVTVRNTDLNVFLKYRRDLYPIMHQILRNAEKIIFISEAYRANFFKNKSIEKVKHSYYHKSLVINNGVDEFWLANTFPKKHSAVFKLLFVGRLSREKNLSRLIQAVLELRKVYKNIELTVVGSLGNDQKKTLNLIQKNTDVVHYLGVVNCKDKLLQIYREHHIFTMPSLIETFGLVYIEALTQGLPVLFTENQGIDGVFEEDLKIGEKVNAHSVDSIREGIEKIILNYDKYNISNINFSEFSWNLISKKYQELYSKVINK